MLVDYQKIYNNLCNSRKSRNITKEEGYEIHHILPRCMYGSDDEDNLVKLTRREHIFAHKLLTKFVRGRHYLALLQAYIWMSSYNRYGEYLNLARKHLTSLSHRKRKVFPLREVKHLLTESSSSRRYERYLRYIGLKKRCRSKWFPDTVNVLVFACFNGFDCVNGLTSIPAGKNNKQSLIEVGILDNDMYFTEQFKNFCSTLHPRQVKVFCKCPIKCKSVFAEINKDLEGVQIWADQLKKGEWLLYKLNETHTQYDEILYKPLRIKDIKKILKDSL